MTTTVVVDGNVGLTGPAPPPQGDVADPADECCEILRDPAVLDRAKGDIPEHLLLDKSPMES